MRPIGWTLTCVLLACTFSKSPRVESARVVTARGDEAGRAKVTKLFPIYDQEAVDPDVRALREFLDDLFGTESKGPESTGRQARTFGVKRIQFMLMPMVYKMGVMMTMMTVLTVISLKGLLIGATLLMLKISTIIAKFSTGWGQQQPPSWSAQPIHVHVHNSLPVGHQQAYSDWMQHSGPGDEEHYYYRG
ncbi:uncharacterized protein LOC128892432 [Hylaeus anthracinus]|uniref:uncharacterized protein LOC128880800 n=1 Tax=Hylaeus volcanicus TaxID=313075 RepID=UPI0023B87F31|nr:uncharacterized protein LOC128880800 [Hylaeus volcanicus]XP_054008831.1 uncharacterized protein LOC128892432 [Hylaeus anthracinus]